MSKPFADVAFAHGVDAALDVEVVRFDESFPPAGADHSPFQPHRPHFHIVAFYTEGRGWHDVDTRRYACGPGTMVFVAPGQVHRFDPHRSLRGVLLVFTPAALDACRLLSGPVRGLGLFNPHVFSPFVALAPDEAAAFTKLANDMLAEMAGPRDLVQAEVLHHLLGIWLVKCRRFFTAIALRDQGRRLADFQRFAELLDRHRHQTRNASDYARRLKTNVRQLGRIVRSITGKTTKQIIDEDLVLEIKRRLVHGGASVGEIAEALGFEETTNLVKYFKRHTGVTPGAFREAVQDLPGSDEQ